MSEPQSVDGVRGSPLAAEIELNRKGAMEGVAVVDRSGSLVYVSPYFARMHGYPPADLIGRPLKQILGEEPDRYLSELLGGAGSETFLTWEALHRHLDGSQFPVRVSAIALSPAGEMSGYHILIVRGLEEKSPVRGAGEEDWEQSIDRDWHRRFFHRSLTGMYRSTLEGQFLEVNAQFARIFGFDGPQEVMELQATELYADRKARRDFISLITRLGSVSNYREVGRRQDGKLIRTLENARLIRDEEGRPQYIEGTLLDITDLVEAEERSWVYFRALEEAQAAILITTPEGTIQYANRAASELYGYLPEHLVGMNFKDLVPEQDRAGVNGYLAILAEKGRWVGEITQVKSDGQKRVIELSMSVVPDLQGQPQVFIACAQDISEVRLLETQLRQAQKMEAIGLLASGIAHNINSPLSAIIMTAEMAQAKHPEVTELGDILQASSRIGEIISNLMTKSRQEQSSAEMEIDVNDLVKTELKFLEANLYFKHNVDVELTLAPELPRIHGLYSDFSQCFQNLVQNALDAMVASDELLLTVRTRFDAGRDKVILSIRDTGSGIAEEDKNRIFEPFFTTKSDVGEANRLRPSGTGLGLSTARQLLAKYGVAIEVDSHVGRGSEFHIVIPVQGGGGDQ